MPSPEAAEAIQGQQALLAAWLSDPTYGIEDFRRIFDEFLVSLPVDPAIDFEDVDAGGVPAIWARAAGARDDKAILHFHSGGLVMGTAAGYKSFGGNLSRTTDTPVLLVDFRLAPEHQFPAQLDDALAAYRYVRARGVAASDIVVSGDSGGGGLALSLLLRLRDSGEELPAAGVVVSALTDWSISGESMVTNAANDPLLPGPPLVEMIGSMLLGPDGDRRDPSASPVFADYTGIPPLLVLAGSIETLRDDGFRVVQAAQRAGVDATWYEGEGMPHIWPVYADRMPEARQALADIGAFVKKHTS